MRKRIHISSLFDIIPIGIFIKLYERTWLKDSIIQNIAFIDYFRIFSTKDDLHSRQLKFHSININIEAPSICKCAII